MKTKINLTFLTVFFSLLVSFSLSAQTPEATLMKNSVTDNVEVYYFHFNARCKTCLTVESETKMSVKELFGGRVEFTAVNLDEKEGEAKGKELGVNSQTLLVVKGDKKINLTNEGFLYAPTNPDKFRKIIEEKIKPLL
jgi:hypothetical protein